MTFRIRAIEATEKQNIHVPGWGGVKPAGRIGEPESVILKDVVWFGLAMVSLVIVLAKRQNPPEPNFQVLALPLVSAHPSRSPALDSVGSSNVVLES